MISSYFPHSQVTAFDLIGETHFYLSQLVAAPGTTLQQVLEYKPKPNAKRGTVKIHGEEVVGASSNVVNFFKEAKVDGLEPLPTRGIFRRCCGVGHENRPVLWITRQSEHGEQQVIFKSPDEGYGLNPKWADFSLSLQQLCNGDYYRPLIIQIMESREGDDNREYGRCETNLQELLGKMDANEGLRLSRPSDGKTFAGAFRVGIMQEQKPSFFNFLQGGLNLNLHIAIDFTASNGDPNDPNSLHTLASGRPNEYQAVISAVGAILRWAGIQTSFVVEAVASVVYFV